MKLLYIYEPAFQQNSKSMSLVFFLNHLYLTMRSQDLR